MFCTTGPHFHSILNALFFPSALGETQRQEWIMYSCILPNNTYSTRTHIHTICMIHNSPTPFFLKFFYSGRQARLEGRRKKKKQKYIRKIRTKSQVVKVRQRGVMVGRKAIQAAGNFLQEVHTQAAEHGTAYILFAVCSPYLRMN